MKTPIEYIKEAWAIYTKKKTLFSLPKSWQF